jgi:hypothetical protein
MLLICEEMEFVWREEKFDEADGALLLIDGAN